MILKILITTAAMSGISGILAMLLVIAERYLANYGECNIIINDEKELKVTGGATLLSTLGSNKIFLPSACGGRGSCAYCKCKVLEGVGQLLPTEEPLLTKSEIKDNVRLACQVKVKQDMKIEIPEELFNIKEYLAQVELIKDLTHDIKLLRLKLVEPDEIKFKSGQYIQLHSKPYDDVKESVSRAYSISSSSSQHNYVDLMVRLMPDGIMTSWVFKHLKQNDKVKFVGPMGDFYLREGDGEMIFIAGGSGMAPMVSLLHEILTKKIDRKVTYFFGAVTKKDLFYLDEMKEFEKKIQNFSFVPALSHPESDDQWSGETGLITEPLEKYLKQIETADVQGYLCGSPGMINACVEILKKYGIPGERTFFDPFA
ncbi:MAG TPA: 2Fe-2S iron-sulfur cluster binding domain-containing protein [bacterium]|nr:2Fe-2S iron-sulfur cluster binding domain-containing protein [bacterium]